MGNRTNTIPIEEDEIKEVLINYPSGSTYQGFVKKIRDMVTVHIFGMTEPNMLERGRMIKGMATAFL